MRMRMSAVLILAVYLVAPVVPGVASESATGLREVKVQCPLCGKEQAGVATVDGELVQRVAGSLALALGEAEKQGKTELAKVLKDGQAAVHSLGLPEVATLARLLPWHETALGAVELQGLKALVSQTSKDVGDLDVKLLATGEYCGEKQCQWTKRLESQHPDWGRNMCVSVGLHALRIGMTPAQVKEAIGKPGHEIMTFGPDSFEIEWEYFRSNWMGVTIPTIHLKFKDGLLAEHHKPTPKEQGEI